MAAESVVVCSESECNELFLSGEVVVWVVWIIMVLMLLCPFLFHFSFEKSFFFSKAGSGIRLFLLSSQLCKLISLFVSM